MTHRRDYVMFSIDGAELPIEDTYEEANARNQYVAEFKRVVQSVANVQQLLGVYKGEEEISFICSRDAFDDYVRDTNWFAEQESILVLHTFGSPDFMVTGNLPAPIGGALHFMDGVETKGVMRQVSEQEAKANGDYTYWPQHNTYFAFEEN